MPRNGSGTYSVPTSFITGTTISSDDVNDNFSDVGSELTASLCRDGQSTMVGQFKAANGTVALPGVCWASDTSTGFYRIGSGNVGISASGTKIAEWSSSGLVDANGNVLLGFATGTAMLFAQTSAPTGFTKSTTHNDKALRVVSGTASSGGSTAFSTVFASRTLLQANLPNVNFTVTATGTSSSDGSHTHTYTHSSFNLTPSGGTSGGTLCGVSTGATTSSDGGHTHTTDVTGTAASGGSGTAMDFAVQYVDVILALRN